MKRVKVAVIAILAVVALLISSRMMAKPTAYSSRKVAMIIMDHPDLPWASSRLLTAMVYARQLREAGIKVQLIFYSFGVQWLSILEELPSAEKIEVGRRRARKSAAGFYRKYIDSELLVEKFKALRDAGVQVALCPGSAERLKIKGELESRKVPLVEVTSDPRGEMNIAPYIKRGYQVLVF